MNGQQTGVKRLDPTDVKTVSAVALTLSIRLAALCAIAQACVMAHSVAKRMERVNIHTPKQRIH